ncbi:EF-hand calcium-binding domain-containing 4A [Gossypium arboreum]|uniref:EF-hand calcium-binding domain-containing 4A n=1 Tax=Gossypium arboreum TaxID=29729 RepID=A0A0B0N6D7_GOSAR|nr:EF-hand calcium-binding domain-containing 4A [Gossypium arboreum]
MVLHWLSYIGVDAMFQTWFYTSPHVEDDAMSQTWSYTSSHINADAMFQIWSYIGSHNPSITAWISDLFLWLNREFHHIKFHHAYL